LYGEKEPGKGGLKIGRCTLRPATAHRRNQPDADTRVFEKIGIFIMKDNTAVGGTLKNLRKGLIYGGKTFLLLLLWMWTTLAITYSNLPWPGSVPQ
jgi:hypothetical protein